MKKYIFLFVLVGVSFMSFGADRDTLRIDDIYLDVESYLMHEVILEFDSVSASDLMIRFENWGGQNFRNYEVVRTSKSETQITLSYIVSTGLSNWYLMLVAEFKDGKVRLRFYDGGNAFIAGPPSAAAGTYHLDGYFKDGFIIYKPVPSGFNGKEKMASAAIAVKKSALNTAQSINENLISQVKSKEESDW